MFESSVSSLIIRSTVFLLTDQCSRANSTRHSPSKSTATHAIMHMPTRVKWILFTSLSRNATLISTNGVIPSSSCRTNKNSTWSHRSKISSIDRCEAKCTRVLHARLNRSNGPGTLSRESLVGISSTPSWQRWGKEALHLMRLPTV